MARKRYSDEDASTGARDSIRKWYIDRGLYNIRIEADAKWNLAGNCVGQGGPAGSDQLTGMIAHLGNGLSRLYDRPLLSSLTVVAFMALSMVLNVGLS